MVKRQEQAGDKRKIEAIAAALAVGASAQATANALSPKVGIPTPALLPVLVIALSKPMDYGISGGVSAPASLESQRTEVLFRAQFVLAASRRVFAALGAGAPRRQALAPEQRYFEQHMEAMQKRRDAASVADRLAARYGATLGWYATLDSRTSPECRKANGKNFTVGERPAIGYPGSVHPHCRCKPGKPHATTQTVYSVKPDRKAA